MSHDHFGAFLDAVSGYTDEDIKALAEKARYNIEHEFQPNVKDAAILLLAAESVLVGDSASPEEGLVWARRLAKSAANGRHFGDCTKQPQTCARCMVEKAEREALRMWK